LIDLNLSSGTEAGSNRNRISEKGAFVLADALSRNYFLQFLNLAGNSVGNNGARKLFHEITRGNTLSVLNLDANDMTGQVGPYLHDFLINCKSIRQLSLKSNKLGDEGVDKFVSGLEGKFS
jgi:Ran GTPase-activating protein (RanGAP) involved in mRNA processing and transport